MDGGAVIMLEALLDVVFQTLVFMLETLLDVVFHAEVLMLELLIDVVFQIPAVGLGRMQLLAPA